MIVIDASAALEWLLGSPKGLRVAKRVLERGDTLHAPHLLDVEVLQALRKLLLHRIIAQSIAETVIADLPHFRLIRYPHLLFLARAWSLRANFSAYDAAYLALAENLNAVLVTCDQKLARAPHLPVPVEVF